MMGKIVETADKVARRFPIKLPPWHEKRLILWAWCKGTSKTGLAQNILQARVEANEDLIENMLKDTATDQGVNVEDLKRQILEGANFVTDPSDPESDGDRPVAID